MTISIKEKNNIFEIVLYVWISKIVSCAILAFNKRKSNYCILNYLFLFCLRDWRSYVFFFNHN